jgi:hypothetical protein
MFSPLTDITLVCNPLPDPPATARRSTLSKSTEKGSYSSQMHPSNDTQCSWIEKSALLKNIVISCKKMYKEINLGGR